jgi:hypothetical protein
LFKSTSRKTTYTLNNPKHGKLEVNAVVVKKYSKGRFKRKGARWFAYAVGRLPKSIEARRVFEMRRQRFGIETSYRQMNQVRAGATSRNPVVAYCWSVWRLLYSTHTSLTASALPFA